VHLAFSGKAVEHQGRREILGVAQDVGEGPRAEAAMQKANAKLRALSERLLARQEQERRYISRELHDDIGQSLLALNFGLHRLAGERGASEQELLRECIDVSCAIQERLRELSLELHPPHLDQLGLGDALSWLVKRQGTMTGLDIECRSGAAPAGRLSAATEAACYRICQEALSNATRHAVASHIVVSLASRAGRVELTVADDGIGFDRCGAAGTREQMGLTSMEERARLAGGDLELYTAPGAGTRVRASFPLRPG
jgi:signal transduction histidine kinase